jgi:septum formation protein
MPFWLPDGRTCINRGGIALVRRQNRGNRSVAPVNAGSLENSCGGCDYQASSRVLLEAMCSSTLILASGSPRRRDLLAAAGVAFDVVESGVEEIRRDDEPPHTFALRMAREKALRVSARYAETPVLAADTIVVCGGEILGKPADSEDARRMLRKLSGVTHTVITAFALARGAAILENNAVESRVTFRELLQAEISAYLATDEPYDKAGSYGIQDAGAAFIAHVEGSRDNVMGLPVREVLGALARNGVDIARCDE